MNEERTTPLSDNRSFEDRVFARFDAIDDRLQKLEARNYDTKPIWEKALATIMETNLEVGGLKKQVDTIENELVATKKYIRDGLVEVRRTLKHYVGKRLDMIHKTVLDDRDDIRDAEERITELERKPA